MFSKIALFGLLAVVLCVVAEEPVPIVSQDSELNPDGSFHWSYESADGSAQQQSGQLEGAGEEVAEAVQGSASWTDSDGLPHSINYRAGRDGYQVDSADLPQSPEIPPQILKGLEWNANHPQQDQE